MVEQQKKQFRLVLPGFWYLLVFVSGLVVSLSRWLSFFLLPVCCWGLSFEENSVMVSGWAERCNVLAILGQLFTFLFLGILGIARISGARLDLQEFKFSGGISLSSQLNSPSLPRCVNQSVCDGTAESFKAAATAAEPAASQRIPVWCHHRGGERAVPRPQERPGG